MKVSFTTTKTVNACYLADYCNSVTHALDLAKANEIGLKPVVTGWSAYKLADETMLAKDMLASKAICLCLVAIPPTL